MSSAGRLSGFGGRRCRRCHRPRALLRNPASRVGRIHSGRPLTLWLSPCVARRTFRKSKQREREQPVRWGPRDEVAGGREREPAGSLSYLERYISVLARRALDGFSQADLKPPD